MMLMNFLRAAGQRVLQPRRIGAESPVTASQTVKALSGHGNDLSVLNTVPGSAADALTWSTDFHPNQPGHDSLYF